MIRLGHEAFDGNAGNAQEGETCVYRDGGGSGGIATSYNLGQQPIPTRTESLRGESKDERLPGERA